MLCAANGACATLWINWSQMSDSNMRRRCGTTSQICYICVVGRLLLAIFSLLLSLFSDSNSGLYAADKIRNPETSQRQVLTYLISDTEDLKSSVDEFFTSSGGSANLYSGERSGGQSLKTSSGGIRTVRSFKSCSRLVKTGKILDTHTFAPFLSGEILKCRSIFSYERYLSSICFMRL